MRSPPARSRCSKAAGLWDALPFQPCPIQQIRVSDGRAGRPASPLFLHFDHRELGEEAAPSAGWWRRAALRMALNRRLHAGRGITVRGTGTRRGSSAAPMARTITLSTGERDRLRGWLWRPRGGRARCARQAKIPVTRYPYRQSGVVCAIAHERPHENTALEHFLPAGPFAQLPMVPRPVRRMSPRSS